MWDLLLFIFVSTEHLSGSTATNEKTMKVPFSNIELAANHKEQQKASGRLYSMIIWVLVIQCIVTFNSWMRSRLSGLK